MLFWILKLDQYDEVFLANAVSTHFGVLDCQYGEYFHIPLDHYVSLLRANFVLSMQSSSLVRLS